MKIHTRPVVLLVSRPSLSPEGVARLLAEYDMSPADWQRGSLDSGGESIPELMGRLCYGSFGKRQGRVGAKDYLANILKGGHGSVLEHACWGFVVCRASRGFTHQMVRHRAGVSPSQESQHFIRYTVEDDEPGAQEAAICLLGVPIELFPLYAKAAESSLQEYAKAWTTLRDGGLKKKEACERARGLLPNCLESRLGLTMNARALRHFCELRGTVDNTLEIRVVACELANMMMVEAPAIFQDFMVTTAADGYPVVTSNYRKV